MYIKDSTAYFKNDHTFETSKTEKKHQKQMERRDIDPNKLAVPEGNPVGERNDEGGANRLERLNEYVQEGNYYQARQEYIAVSEHKNHGAHLKTPTSLGRPSTCSRQTGTQPTIEL